MATMIDHSDTELNVVIIGETGTGKSTLINYLTNLFHDGSLNNLKVAIPTRCLPSNMSLILPEYQEDFLDDVTRRKTRECNRYQFQVKKVNFNFFDTPGINDTGGYLADNENLQKIFQCIQSFDYLTALVFVLNGTQARLTINIKNVLERFHDRMPDVFYANIVVILTNCSSHSVNFDSIALLNHPPVFYMQNSAFSSDPRTWSEHTRDILQRDWEISMRTMNEFIKTLLLLTPVPTESVSKMNNDRDTIRSVLHESRLMVMELQHIEEELISLEQASQIYSENMEKYERESTTQIKTIQVNEITMTPYHNTICLKCNIVCHERCTLNETVQVGEDVFRHCTIMNNGRCTICPGHCSYDMHYHDRRLIKSVPRTVKFAISSLSNRRMEVEEEKAACEIKCKTVQEAKRLIEHVLQEQFNKIQKACMNVQQNCQGFNIVEELHIFIRLFKTEMKSLRSPSVISKATKFIEQLETLANRSSLPIFESSYSTASKRKTQTSRKRNQPPVASSINADDSMIIRSSSFSTLRTQSDHIPLKIPVIEDDSFNRFETSEQQILAIPENQNYSECTTEQLIDLIRQSIENHALITKELIRRCEGTSLGYLSPTHLSTLCEYYTSARLLGSDELVGLHLQLQSEIQESTDPNPFELLSASIDKLLHLTAIKLCLRNEIIYQ